MRAPSSAARALHGDRRRARRSRAARASSRRAAGAAPVDGGRVAKAVAPATAGSTTSSVPRASGEGRSARHAAKASSAQASIGMGSAVDPHRRCGRRRRAGASGKTRGKTSARTQGEREHGDEGAGRATRIRDGLDARHPNLRCPRTSRSTPATAATSASPAGPTHQGRPDGDRVAVIRAGQQARAQAGRRAGRQLGDHGTDQARRNRHAQRGKRNGRAAGRRNSQNDCRRVAA